MSNGTLLKVSFSNFSLKSSLFTEILLVTVKKKKQIKTTTAKTLVQPSTWSSKLYFNKGAVFLLRLAVAHYFVICFVIL